MPSRLRWGIRVLALILLARTATASPPARSAYVLSANDAKVTRVDLDTGAVLPDVTTAGAFANRIERDADGRLGAIVSSGSDEVALFDFPTETVFGTVPLPAGSNPWTAEIVGTRVFVTCLLTDTLYEIDATTLAVTDSAATGTAPEGIAVTGGHLYVANTGFDFGTFGYGPGTVTVLDLDDLSEVATVPVSVNPQDCLVASDGNVHVVCTGNFGPVTGSIDVIDPGSKTVIASLPVPAYPGGGAVSPSGSVHLSVTTPSFGSEIWTYVAASLVLVHDGSNPLLPSFDFYGEPAATAAQELLVPDFSADLLLVEMPEAPGAPTAVLVGDGPIDVAVIDDPGPVPIVLRGISAENVASGIRLSWNALLEADVAGFVVERSVPARGETRRVADDLPAARNAEWTDEAVTDDERYVYRVGAVGFRGGLIWSEETSIVRRSAPSRLAFARVRPNPARGPVSFDVVVPRDGAVELELLDAAGRRIARRAVGGVPAGSVTFEWDGRDDTGTAVASGMYFARVRSGGEVAVERVLRVR
ncbi:MAG: FlgD immunoglobulin-like domain containing protein [Candidatus Eiseniibacteriota bacterium]